MYRQLINRVLFFILIINLQILACKQGTADERNLLEPSQDTESNIISWPLPILEDTVSLVGLIKFDEIAAIQASELHFSRLRGFITADSMGFILSGIWTSQGVETAAYSWDASTIWIDRNTHSPLLGASVIHDDKVYVSDLGRSIIVLDRISGDLLEEFVLPGEQELSNGAPFSFATSFAMSDSLIVLGWFSWVPGLTDFCATACDVDNEELFSLGTHPADYEGKLSECRIACSNNAVYFSSVAEDRVFSLSKEGEVLTCFTSGHYPQRELESPSVTGERVLFPVTASLQSTSPDILWILYGQGAFDSDSSEIWQIDLSSMEAYMLPLSASAIGFCIDANNIAIMYRSEDCDSLKMWSSSENCIQVGCWNYETE